MMTSLLIPNLAALAFSAPFQIHEYSDVSANAKLYLYAATQNKQPAIFVHDNATLKIYDNWNQSSNRTFVIPQGTYAFDSADLDEDGLLDCVFLQREKVELLLSASGEPTRREFLLHEPLDWTSPNPVPAALVTNYEDEQALAVHHTEHLNLYTMHGQLLANISPPTAADNAPTKIPVYPHQIASPSGMEFRIDTTWSQHYDYPGGQPEGIPEDANQHITQRVLQESASKDPGEWPAFPLQSASDDQVKIRAAKAPPDFRNTYIRIQRPEIRNLPVERGQYNYSPRKMFPGNLLLTKTGLPDINHDGYTDLIFWTIPPPGASMSHLIRGAQGGTWNVRLTAHLYDQRRQSFTPRPVTKINLSLPMAWMFLRPGNEPFKNLLFTDLDSDGDSDFVCSTRDHTLSAWLYDDGYPSRPTYTSTFKGAIELIHWDTMGDGKAVSMLLRSDSALYLLTLPKSD